MIYDNHFRCWLNHYTTLFSIQGYSSSQRNICHILRQYHNSFSLMGSASKNLIELMASEARSSSPWMITMGGSCNLGHCFYAIISIISCISIKVFTQTFSWYIRGSLINILEAVGLRVTLSKLKANRPALFGMIFSAKSERAETTLLCSGFLSEGLPTMIPLGFSSFLYLVRVILMSAPEPWPKQKQGSLGYISRVFLMKLVVSFKISFISSKYPLSPCDLPWPR